MCFSASASFSAGIGLLLVGAVAARRVQKRSQWPYALIPTFFGLQQLVEGALWLTLPDHAPVCQVVLTQVFSGFSQVFWPVLIPLSVLFLEAVVWRRTLLLGVATAGAAVGLFLLVLMVQQPVLAVLDAGHIQYVFPHYRELTATALYLTGVCISPLVSSHRPVRLFGVLATLSMAVSYALYANWFISVWCFFAAVLSVVVLQQLAPRRTLASLQTAGTTGAP